MPPATANITSKLSIIFTYDKLVPPAALENSKYTKVITLKRQLKKATVCVICDRRLFDASNLRAGFASSAF